MVDPVTFADVANKIVDKTSAAASELIAKMGQTAPLAWSMAYRQTIIWGIENLLGIVGLVIALIVAMKVANKVERENEYGGVEGGWWIRGVSLLFIVPFIVLFSIEAINYLANPAYWTVIDILNKLQGK